ncbi:MAG: tRNA pseudouridine(55) synthase TruB [Desulfitobacteriaceae bacterium]|nr:tRNA pseudouridine(55) synthase TruB [Desulfitobacteriaceae bacterium]MDD4401530.1 tRNA pseudouridine(55) synthase TruB [Desulfitobacteriaceae bacterium]
MNGVINLLKPPGMTSSDVVVWLKKRLHTAKVGHIGTLDPGVTGVLPICVGKATRIAEYLSQQGKFYRAEITFGITTDTQDSYGKVLKTTQPYIKKDDILKTIPCFTGLVQQLPPMYSAVRHKGKHLYEYARQGVEIERVSRTVNISFIKLLHWLDGEYPQAVLDIECSKGTYIRTLCHDLGESLGCGAFMSYLLRLRSGPFGIQESWTLEEIEQFSEKDDTSFLIPIKHCLALPKVCLLSNRARAFCNGLPTRADEVVGPLGNDGISVQVFENEILLGIGIWRENSLYPHKVLR